VGKYISGDGVYRQLYSGWCHGGGDRCFAACGEGLVRPAGKSIKIGDVGSGKGIWVCATKRYSTLVVSLGDEAFWEKAVGFCQSGCGNVRESFGYVGGEGVDGWVSPYCIKASGGQGN